MQKSWYHLLNGTQSYQRFSLLRLLTDQNVAEQVSTSIRASVFLRFDLVVHSTSFLVQFSSTNRKWRVMWTMNQNLTSDLMITCVWLWYDPAPWLGVNYQEAINQSVSQPTLPAPTTGLSPSQERRGSPVVEVWSVAVHAFHTCVKNTLTRNWRVI